MAVVKTNVKHASMNISIQMQSASLAMKTAHPAMAFHQMSAILASQGFKSCRIPVFPAGMGITLMFRKINVKLATLHARLAMEVV